MRYLTLLLLSWWILIPDVSLVCAEESPWLFARSWGDSGSANEDFGRQSPYRGDVNPTNNRAYFVDTQNNRIKVYELDGTFVESIGTTGSDSGQLNFPRTILFDSNGDYYVSQSVASKIQKFDGDDNSLIAVIGSTGTGDSLFVFPDGMALDSEGDLWVVCHDNYVVQQFDTTSGNPRPHTSFLTSFGNGAEGTGDDDFDHAHDIIIDDNDILYIADGANARVKMHDTSGTYIGESSGNISHCDGLAWLNREKTAYVVCSGADSTLSFFKADQTFLYKYRGGPGSPLFDGPLALAQLQTDVFMDYDNDIMYVTNGLSLGGAGRVNMNQLSAVMQYRRQKLLEMETITPEDPIYVGGL
jgi:sugar lactone lactonase YvrE